LLLLGDGLWEEAISGIPNWILMLFLSLGRPLLAEPVDYAPEPVAADN
jgi:hypothetical protein